MSANANTGLGYALLFHGPGRVQFLNDRIVWGNAYAFDWAVGQWYHVCLSQDPAGNLNGKIWPDGQPEPATARFTQAGWPALVGFATLDGGSAVENSNSTVSFRQMSVRVPVVNTATVFSDDFSSGSSLGSAWKVTGGTFSQADSILSQTSLSGLERKAVVTAVPALCQTEVHALVRLDSLQGNGRGGIGVASSPQTGFGYNFVCHGPDYVQFLDDRIAWGNRFAFNCRPGTWYEMKLRQEANGVLRAKIWEEGSVEPANWMFTQNGWQARCGALAVNGGSNASDGASASNSTVSFRQFSATADVDP